MVVDVFFFLHYSCNPCLYGPLKIKRMKDESSINGIRLWGHK
jgi:hypothetical protein